MVSNLVISPSSIMQIPVVPLPSLKLPATSSANSFIVFSVPSSLHRSADCFFNGPMMTCYSCHQCSIPYTVFGCPFNNLIREFPLCYFPPLVRCNKWCVCCFFRSHTIIKAGIKRIGIDSVCLAFFLMLCPHVLFAYRFGNSTFSIPPLHIKAVVHIFV